MRTLGFDDRFIRKWTYYLGYCEAAFTMAALFYPPRDGKFAELLTCCSDGPSALGPALAALGVIVILLARPRH